MPPAHLDGAATRGRFDTRRSIPCRVPSDAQPGKRSPFRAHCRQRALVGRAAQGDPDPPQSDLVRDPILGTQWRAADCVRGGERAERPGPRDRDRGDGAWPGGALLRVAARHPADLAGRPLRPVARQEAATRSPESRPATVHPQDGSSTVDADSPGQEHRTDGVQRLPAQDTLREPAAGDRRHHSSRVRGRGRAVELAPQHPGPSGAHRVQDADPMDAQDHRLHRPHRVPRIDGSTRSSP